MSDKAARRGRDSKPESRAVGRPLVTLDDLPEGWEAIMTSIYQIGGTDVEVRVALAKPPARAMGHDTFKRLQDCYPEFSEAVQNGQSLAETWYWQQARLGMFHPNFKSKIWIVLMRNRFGFKGADANFVPGFVGDKDTVQVYLPTNGREKKIS